jgi:hypothetical protein
VAIDAPPDSPDDSLNRTAKFAQMTGGTVHRLHVARGQNIPSEISVGSDIGVPTAEDVDVDIIVVGYQHHRGSVVAEHVIRRRPHCSILLARPPESHRQSA